MIFGKTKLELKVGVFVFGGILILAAFILLIGNIKTWSSGYKVNFVFCFVNGVKIGAPVRYAGVDVGEVKELKLVFDSQNSKANIKINCWVNKKIKIPMDSTIWVNTLGLLGEKYIEIMPGADYTQLLGPGQDLAGRDPMPMQEVGELAKSIGKNLDQTFTQINSKEGTVGKLIYDDTVYNNIEAFTDDIKKHPWKLFFRGRDK